MSLDKLIGQRVMCVSVERPSYDKDHWRGPEHSITFHCDTGSLKLYHEQDCCESVVIEEIIGDLDDLIGEPILVAEARSDERKIINEFYDGETWTFYTFRTIRGTVDIRWCGSSSGYYSEEVHEEWTPKEAVTP